MDRALDCALERENCRKSSKANLPRRPAGLVDHGALTPPRRPMSTPTKFLLDESQMPTPLVQPRGRPAGAAAAAAAPGHEAAGRPGRPGADLPDGPDRAGGQHRARDRDSRGGAGGLRALAADAAGPRAPPGKGPRHAGADLLQGRRRQPARQPQAQHGRAAGLLQQEGRASSSWPPRPGPASGASSLAFACTLFGLRVQGLHGQGELRAEAVPPLDDAHLGRHRASPARPNETNAGRAILAQDPDCPGSLGIAISEAVEVAAHDDDTKYTLGSVLNHVLLHQTVIGLEAKKQMEMAGDYPDVVIGCVGGGSNFAGLAFPFIRQQARRQDEAARFVAVEPAACPSLTPRPVPLRLRRHGEADAADQDVHAGHTLRAAGHPRRRAALPRHGPDGQPWAKLGLIEADAVPPDRVLRGRRAVRRTEGIIPGARSRPRHPRARSTRRSAAGRRAKRSASSSTFSGHGLFDMGAYDRYFAGELVDQPTTRRSWRWRCRACRPVPA